MFRSLLAVALIFACSAGSTLHAQDWAKARLEKSGRHMEWVKVTHGQREVDAFLVFPEVKEKATAVVVIHEIFGLTDWVRTVADQLAEAGYIAIAPDLLSGSAARPASGAQPGLDDARKMISTLPPEQVTADLIAAADHVSKLPAANGKVAVCGFCWGGGQAFRLATNYRDLKASFVFYGTGPDKPEEIARIACPVYGFYGGDDARVTMTVPKSRELMDGAKKRYAPTTYDGAGHGFMRAAEGPEPRAADVKAHDAAWEQWKSILKQL